MNPKERYKLVPTTMRENLRFRRDLLIRCQTDLSFRESIIRVCKEDCLFWMNSFAWLFEPRPRFGPDGREIPKQIPFIAWEHQAPEILKIKAALGIMDVGVEKSRGEGGSWISVLFACHSWLFEDMASVGMVSKDEMSADDPNNPDSMFWKVDHTISKLPRWMGGVRDVDWKRDQTRHTLKNLRNGSTITAYSATGNVASGGRKSYFIMDELAKFPRPSDKEAMASTQHVTESRLFVSTPVGSSGAYYDAMHDPNNMVRVILCWRNNPVRNRGLYEMLEGMPVATDPVNNPLPPFYDPPSQDVLDKFSRLRRKGFKLESKLRSPWYDNECDRAGATPQNIAQELDRDYGGSSYRVLGHGFMTKTEAAILDPIKEGDVNFNLESLTDARFIESSGGPLKLWLPLDTLGQPPRGIYVIGADISAGTGGSFSSNSTLCGIDLITGEQVFEYASNTVPPAAFADLSISIARWFGDAYLAWESNGPGASFTNQVIEQEYFNIYHRKVLWRKGKSEQREIGWWTDKRSKEVLFEALQNAVMMNEFVIRSRECIKEAGQYVRRDGEIHHALVRNAVDDSKGSSHGDRVIAAAVCLQAARDRPLGNRNTDMNKVAPPGTMARRLQDHERELNKVKDVWDEGINVANNL